MSFILDALKKSENERARQKGPALLEARVVSQRRGVPPWAIVIALVLVANLVVLTLVVLRRPQASPVAVAPVPAPAPVAAQPPVVVQVPVPLPQAPAPIGPPAPPPDVYLPPGANYVPPPALPPDDAPPAASVVNPADYQPARPAAPRQGPALSSAPAPAPPMTPADAALPLAGDLAGNGLPEQRLTLHIYDDRPSVRMILLNSQKLLEGDTSSEGVRVERITPEGAILSWRGQRFRVQPGG